MLTPTSRRREVSAEAVCVATQTTFYHPDPHTEHRSHSCQAFGSPSGEHQPGLRPACFNPILKIVTARLKHSARRPSPSPRAVKHDEHSIRMRGYRQATLPSPARRQERQSQPERTPDPELANEASDKRPKSPAQRPIRNRIESLFTMSKSHGMPFIRTGTGPLRLSTSTQRQTRGPSRPLQGDNPLCGPDGGA
jgi:hypothetical protein